MNKGVFFDRNHQPSTAELKQVLGNCYPWWEKLTQFIKSHPQIERKWSAFGPMGFGCGYRYKYRRKALIALYPQRGQIMAQVVLGKKQAEQALRLHLGERITKVIENTHQGHDGRWLSIPVQSLKDAEAIQLLIHLKITTI